MGAPFSDITLYIPTPYSNDSPQYWEETSLENFVSDLSEEEIYYNSNLTINPYKNWTL